MSDEEAPLINPGPHGSEDDEGPSAWAMRRKQCRAFLESKQKHYFILTLVSLDVMGILVDILVSLVTCDMGTSDEPWVESVQEVTKVCGLIFSSLFLVELGLCVWAFGIESVPPPSSTE